ncbi:MAG: serine/threonine protein kinase, partial [Coleofasciculus sp. S288]|nr:serine/threonine protein kinase [Coleofasciculus sp. S288]
IGRTFLAIDEQDTSKPRCIIKQLSPKKQGTKNPEKALELFRQDVARLSELGQHPQIPQLLACFEPDDWMGTGMPSALVQTLIEGQSLAQQLEAEGAFSETQIRQLLKELLPVLQFVHEHGVIHRDINPDNIIRCSTNSQLVLVDFSAAKITTKTLLAQVGTVIGSAAYTAPEQLMGQALQSSDLYSLGVTCIHLLTNIHPFNLFNSLESIWVWQDYLTDLISNQLCKILNKMLESEVKQRYQSATEILQDLEPEKNVSTRPITVAQPNFTSPSVASKILTPTWKCVRTLRGHLSSIHSIAFSPDGRILASGSADKTIKIWNLDSAAVPYTLSGHLNLIDAVAFSPDGCTLASGSWDYTIKIWQVETGELLHTLCGHSGWIKSVAISPDGQNLASGSADKTIKIWNLGTGELQKTLSGHSSTVCAIAISPDGQNLASGSADKTIKIWNLSSGDIQLTLNGHSDAVNSFSFSPSGQILISGSADKTIKVWNLNSGTLLHTLNSHSESVNSVAINIEGNTLISGSADNTIKIWHPASGDLLYTLSGHSAGVTSVAISSDNRIIASGSQDKTIKIWQFE